MPRFAWSNRIDMNWFKPCFSTPHNPEIHRITENQDALNSAFLTQIKDVDFFHLWCQHKWVLMHSFTVCSVCASHKLTSNYCIGVLITFTSPRVSGGVKTKAKLLFCQASSACRCTRWKKCSLLLICSLMRHYGMFSFLWRFVLIVRQVALHRLWDFMDEWAHYQYEKLLKYLVMTYFYLQGGKYLPLCEVHSDLWRISSGGLATNSSWEFAVKQAPNGYTNSL